MSWNLVTDVDTKWPRVEPIVAKAFRDSFDDFSIEDVYGWLKARKMHLLVYETQDKTDELACIFEFVVHPGRKIMRIVLLAGHGFDEAYPEWENEVEAFARKVGCDALEAWCRDPQARLFSRWGMQKQFNVVRKEIGHAG